VHDNSTTSTIWTLETPKSVALPRFRGQRPAYWKLDFSSTITRSLNVPGHDVADFFSYPRKWYSDLRDVVS